MVAPTAIHRYVDPVDSAAVLPETVRVLKSTTEAWTATAQFLEKTLPVGRFVGIPNALESMSSTGVVTIPSHVSYNTASFLIMGRWYIPVAGVAGSGETVFSRRGTGTAIQWEIALGQTT